MAWATLGRELKALNAINNSGLWMTLAFLGHELRSLNAMDRMDCG